MSGAFSYERYDRRTSSRRSALTYWVPLAITATVAAGGVAAWVWSARSENDSTTSSSEDDYLSYGEDSDRRRGVDARPTGTSRPPSYGVSEGCVNDGSRDIAGDRKEDDSFLGRMSGALRRSPSPQQILDGASKRVAAGVAAAGAVMGSALGAIREEDGNYQDHDRWKEEQLKKGVTATSGESKTAVDTHADAFASSVRGGSSATAAPRAVSAGKRKTIAIIVSAETHEGFGEEHRDSYKTEEATLLSHLPQVDTSRINLLILIYNPKPRASSSSAGDHNPSSLSSSYSAINTPAITPGEELASLDPQPYTETSSHNSLYALLHKQAVNMVEKPSNVMTFNTPTGYTHMLKHLGPETVYIVDLLAGERGANVETVKDWVGQIVVVVGGDGSGLGGLIDTEDEGEGRGKGKREQWWEHSDMVGLGKGVEVVDGVRFPEDWERRVGGRD